MLLVKTPKLFKILFPKLVWSIPARTKEVYLTFDDGPTPEITEWVLQQLALYNAKATFFCIGKNVDANPEVFKQIVDAGHSIGNHTQNHLNAWKVTKEQYLLNVKEAEGRIINLYPEFKSKKLFRPPYGRFTNAIVRQLKNDHYTVVAWDIITEDYDKKVSPEKVFQNVIKYVSPGSIIVFHDSVKAFGNLRQVLPKILQFLYLNGYQFSVL